MYTPHTNTITTPKLAPVGAMELVYIFSTASRLKFGRTSNYKASLVTGSFITTLRRFRPKCVLRTPRNCEYEKSAHGAFQTTCTINTVQSRFTRRRQFHHPAPPPTSHTTVFLFNSDYLPKNSSESEIAWDSDDLPTQPPPSPPHTHTGFDSDALPKIAPIMKCIDCGSDYLLKQSDCGQINKHEIEALRIRDCLGFR
jgi:hypothetical protein